jgi:hypothetical protein
MPFIKVDEIFPYECTTLVNTDKIVCVRFHEGVTTIHYSEKEWIKVSNKYQDIINQL